jgi:hypothetical protein
MTAALSMRSADQERQALPIASTAKGRNTARRYAGIR